MKVLIVDLDLIIRLFLGLLGKLVEMKLESIDNFSDVSFVQSYVYLSKVVAFVKIVESDNERGMI